MNQKGRLTMNNYEQYIPQNVNQMDLTVYYKNGNIKKIQGVKNLRICDRFLEFKVLNRRYARHQNVSIKFEDIERFEVVCLSI
jgi:hypothetical protein